MALAGVHGAAAGLDVPLDGFANLVPLAVTFGLAELSYRYIEMPIRRGQLKVLWHRFRPHREQRAPILKKGAIIGAAVALFLTFVGYRVVTLPPAEADYLHGLESVSALDAVPRGQAGPAPSATPNRPGTVTARASRP